VPGKLIDVAPANEKALLIGAAKGTGLEALTDLACGKRAVETVMKEVKRTAPKPGYASGGWKNPTSGMG
jgi:hypothetical protein